MKPNDIIPYAKIVAEEGVQLKKRHELCFRESILDLPNVNPQGRAVPGRD